MPISSGNKITPAERRNEHQIFHNQLTEALLNYPLEEEDDRQLSRQEVDYIPSADVTAANRVNPSAFNLIKYVY